MVCVILVSLIRMDWCGYGLVLNPFAICRTNRACVRTRVYKSEGQENQRRRSNLATQPEGHTQPRAARSPEKWKQRCGEGAGKKLDCWRPPLQETRINSPQRPPPDSSHPTPISILLCLSSSLLPQWSLHLLQAWWCPVAAP